jgi:hypothetical protein
MEILNKGKLNLYYLGDGPGDKNLPDTVLLKDAILSKGVNEEIVLTFEIDYPKFPIHDLIHFNLNTFNSQHDKITLYYLQSIVLSKNEFLVIANYVWSEPVDLENFEIIARFEGQIPHGLNSSVCPPLN